jgi:hypothetical protein
LRRGTSSPHSIDVSKNAALAPIVLTTPFDYPHSSTHPAPILWLIVLIRRSTNNFLNGTKKTNWKNEGARRSSNGGEPSTRPNLDRSKSRIEVRFELGGRATYCRHNECIECMRGCWIMGVGCRTNMKVKSKVEILTTTCLQLLAETHLVVEIDTLHQW